MWMTGKMALAAIIMMTGSACLGQDKILVAAASDLKFALDSIIAVLHQTQQTTIQVTYGSSGKLTEQIMNGAPFDVLLSADISYPERLQRAHQTGADIVPYARGRIVLWSKNADPRETEMKLLTDPSITKVAIANPRHAPYGKRAMESMVYYQLEGEVTPKLVFGENVSQAAHFAATGAADVAIIALSLARSPNMKRESGTFFLIPEVSHQPIIQAGVVTRHGKNKQAAHAFVSSLTRQDAIRILQYFGFTTP